MAKLKYMGSADVARLDVGEDFGGRVSEGLAKAVEFNQKNNWIVDTDEAGVTAEQLAAAIEQDPDRFKDVTDMKRVPSNENQRLFLGHKTSAKADDEPADTGQGDVTDNGDVTPGGSLVGDGSASTVGGSTAGDAGTGGRRGRTT